MDEATRELVRERAGNRCEYCLHPQEHAETTHHIEHIVSGRPQAGPLQRLVSRGLVPTT